MKGDAPVAQSLLEVASARVLSLFSKRHFAVQQGGCIQVALLIYIEITLDKSITMWIFIYQWMYKTT